MDLTFTYIALAVISLTTCTLIGLFAGWCWNVEHLLRDIRAELRK